LTPLAISSRGNTVSCPSLLRDRPAAPEFLGDLSRGPLRPVRAPVTPLSARLRQDDTAAQFARFVLVGGSSTAVYAVLFIALESQGYLTAHLFATIASSILANEMHRRLTFRAEERLGWLGAQIQAGGVSFVGLVTTSLALGWLDSATDSAPVVVQITLVGAVTAAIGLMRFIALRWIFRPTELPAAR
jgi:putative flippase GtrA